MTFVKCSVCGVSIRKENLGSHMADVHPEGTGETEEEPREELDRMAEVLSTLPEPKTEGWKLTAMSSLVFLAYLLPGK